MRFFTGLHQPSDAQHFDAAFVSVNRLRDRKGPFAVGDWIMDSGAFTEIRTYGRYRHSVSDYAVEIRRWAGNGHLLAASAQDWMCEAHIIKRTAIAEGLLPAPAGCDPLGHITDAQLRLVPALSHHDHAARILLHQTRTIDRYDALLAEDTGVYIMPVLQGYQPADYVAHLALYGSRLAPGAWVGVGSICKRNGDPRAIQSVLQAIRKARPDLRLHGFGLKTTALANPWIRSMLDTADSMAWSFSARREGRNPNDWREAMKWTENITARPVQWLLDLARVAA